MKSKIALIFAITLLLGFGGNFTTAQTQVDAQDRLVKIGIARWVESSDFDENIQGFKESLEEYGFIEGVNTEYIEKNPNGDKLKQREIIQEFSNNTGYSYCKRNDSRYSDCLFYSNLSS